MPREAPPTRVWVPSESWEGASRLVWGDRAPKECSYGIGCVHPPEIAKIEMGIKIPGCKAQLKLSIPKDTLPIPHRYKWHAGGTLRRHYISPHQSTALLNLGVVQVLVQVYTCKSRAAEISRRQAEISRPRAEISRCVGRYENHFVPSHTEISRVVGREITCREPISQSTAEARLTWPNRNGLGVESLHVAEVTTLIAILRHAQVEPNAETQLAQIGMQRCGLIELHVLHGHLSE